MNNTFKLVRQCFKLFIRSNIECILLFLIILSTSVGLTFYLSVPAEVFLSFTFIVRCVVFESILFMIMSYLYLRKAKKSNIDETISSITFSNNYYTLVSFFFLLAILLIYNIFILLFLLANTIKTGEYSMLMNILITQYPLNVILPQIIMLIITVLISNIKSSAKSLPLFLVMLILFSPYMDTLIWSSKPSFPIDKIIDIIHMPFSLFYQNSVWAVDNLYGMQNEPYKIASILFWSFVFILFFYVIKAKKNRLLKIILCSFLAITSFGCVYIPQNKFRLDDKWDGAYEDNNYYQVSSAPVFEKEIPVEYNITNYNLDINLGLMLNVSGQLHINSTQKRRQFVFTLYHKYDIESIDSELDFEYSRNGDYIYLNFDKDVKDVDISISYKGYHNIMFSNYQAVQLPGFFPWYPMAGEKNVFFYKNNIYGINPYNKINKANFQVEVNAPYTVISNLNKKGTLFSGTSDSLTILGGNIGLYDSNKYNVQNYLEYEHSPYVPKEENLSDIEMAFDDITDTLDKYFHITNLSSFKNKKIFVCSKALARIQSIGSYAEFDDYVIITSITSIWQDFINYHLLNNDNDNFYVNLLMYPNYDFINDISEIKQSFLDYIVIQSDYVQGENNKEQLEFLNQQKEYINNMNEDEFQDWLIKLGKYFLGGEKDENPN